MKRFIAVRVDGVTQTHLPYTNEEYATLCGIDGDDPVLNQFPAEPGNKVDCHHCRAIFDLCSQFRASDFKCQIV